MLTLVLVVEQLRLGSWRAKSRSCKRRDHDVSGFATGAAAAEVGTSSLEHNLAKSESLAGSGGRMRQILVLQAGESSLLEFAGSF